MAPHSSTLAWRIPWTEEPGRLQIMGSLRVGYDWVTSLSVFTFMHWRRKWQPTHKCSCLENPRDGGAWWAAAYGVAQNRLQLKWLSSNSSLKIFLFKRSEVFLFILTRKNNDQSSKRQRSCMLNSVIKLIAYINKIFREKIEPNH